LQNAPVFAEPDLPSVTTGLILGAGGNSRPPIAPRFTQAPGQRPAEAAAALLNNKRYRARELLVEVKAETSNAVKDRFANEYGVEVREVGSLELAGVRIWHLTLPPGQNLRRLLVGLLQDSRVLAAQPNYIYTPTQGSRENGGVKITDEAAVRPAPDLPTGAGVKVAIIDSCVERDHAELLGSATSSFDATQSGPGACQPENHGTAVASLIAGHSKVQGTAAGASLLLAKAFAFTSEEKEVAATSREIALALNWAASSGAQLMNLSFAGPADPLIERMVAAAYTKGIVLVAAAGNAGPASQPLYPAAYPEVIAVTATDGKREIYSAANRGRHICVSARGVDVLVAHIHNTYGTDSGTSFAAAKVSGVVASLLEKRPKAGPEGVRAALQTTATEVPHADRTGAGYGLVNVAAAVAFVEASVPQ
jgi:subtilisin family serine protease